jgi:hypothetical protein
MCNRNTLENDYRKSISPSHIGQTKPFIVKRWINISTFNRYCCSHFDDFSSQKEDVLKTTCPQVTLRRRNWWIPAILSLWKKVCTPKRQSSENTVGLYLYETATTVYEDQSGDTVLLTELYTFHFNFYLKHFSTTASFFALWYLVE